ALDGRTGQGGVPIILRSTRGTIDLVPDDPTRLALASGRPAEELTPVDANAIKLVQTAGAGPVADAAPAGPAAEVEHAATEPNSPSPGAAGGAGLMPGEEVVKVNVRTVNLNAKVTDLSGKLIPDLTKDDFLVFEDNVAQEVVHFEPITAPVNVVLLLDLSGSTKDRMKIMKKAAKKFIDSLNPNTRIAAAAFTRRFMLISDFTADRKLLKDRIDDVKNFNSGTAFYDSMWATLDLFKEVQERRKAVVVLTDGVDNSISSEQYEVRHPFDELVARMAQEDVTIYPIYFDTEYEVTVKHRQGQDSHESYVTARKQLQRIADDTGGTLFKAERAEDLEGVYQRVASELQTFYNVAYNPQDTNYDGRWRNVTIQIKGRPAAVRTKRGFYAK
ncbi:MAG TPA: VWA domain-containing protein, partial [Pyrinomonadaceae bacterium]